MALKVKASKEELKEKAEEVVKALEAEADELNNLIVSYQMKVGDLNGKIRWIKREILAT